ncbi:hypothetical protein L9F63_020430 [Diploptera punctata]|uniref:Chemosensory protein n=1 Tax=Diploptera punctata TaxID=6984 RepID=A0AAD7ZSQ3_DIPPU|nr:hypothetical protein L9F63_020430 [Diploptera punctata]
MGLDADALSQDPKATQDFINCLLETGPCTEEEDKYRLGLPEVVKTTCSKCSPEVKDFFIKTTRFVSQKHPEQWKKLTAKYDPDGKYEASILRLAGVKA